MEHDDELILTHSQLLTSTSERLARLEKDVGELKEDLIESRKSMDKAIEKVRDTLNRLGWALAANLGGIVIVLAIEVLKR